MSNSKDTISCLQALGLNRDESKLYLELLREPRSHLELARATGINRTKVYRLADELEKRSLINTQTDDRGTLLVAADPGTLEVELVTKEEKLKQQRTLFNQLLPVLQSAQQSKDDPHNFTVNTYEGVQGFKQMLWHELKTKDEILILGSGTIEDLVDSKSWADKLRSKTVAAGYNIREILNPNSNKPVFTLKDEYRSRYTEQFVQKDVLLLLNQISIYNDTVATYYWHDAQKVGIEVTNRAYATMMRQIFEQYWLLTK